MNPIGQVAKLQIVWCMRIDLMVQYANAIAPYGPKFDWDNIVGRNHVDQSKIINISCLSKLN